MTERVMKQGRRHLPFGLALILALGVLIVAGAHNQAGASVQIVRSTIKGSDGKNYWVTNHLTKQGTARATAAALPRWPPAGWPSRWAAMSIR